MRRVPGVADLVLVKQTELEAVAIKARFDDVAECFTGEAFSASLRFFFELEKDHAVIVAVLSCDTCEFVLAWSQNRAPRIGRGISSGCFARSTTCRGFSGSFRWVRFSAVLIAHPSLRSK